MNAYNKTLILGLLLLCSFKSLNAQQREVMPARQRSEFANTLPEYCWRTEQMLWNVSANTPANETIIVIARLGAKESKSILNKRRLHNVLIHWTHNPDNAAKRAAENIVLAEGERTDGRFGQIEFYVRGNLVEIIKLRPNADLETGDCYAGIDGLNPPCNDKSRMEFYPCKDLVPKQKPKGKAIRKKNNFR